MINNIFSFTIQAAVAVPAQSPSVPAFQSAAAWIDDEIRLLVLGY
jgi:hypothetical protein